MVRQVMRGRSHALLQEAGINLVALLEEEGFYVRRRIMSAPLTRRGRASFGAAAPIELPTPRELQRFAEGCGAFMLVLGLWLGHALCWLCRLKRALCA